MFILTTDEWRELTKKQRIEHLTVDNLVTKAIKKRWDSEKYQEWINSEENKEIKKEREDYYNIMLHENQLELLGTYLHEYTYWIWKVSQFYNWNDPLIYKLHNYRLVEILYDNLINY